MSAAFIEFYKQIFPVLGYPQIYMSVIKKKIISNIVHKFTSRKNVIVDDILVYRSECSTHYHLVQVKVKVPYSVVTYP